ncbi:MAG: type II toxin-antitoxin system RelE/ParE family toxin [Rhabdochlamydiaceae bacterium]|nr:type II toxin-antitoxin system RelE/ParE family toxin [Rhabdochlamydiaceae bacterium]
MESNQTETRPLIYKVELTKAAEKQLENIPRTELKKIAKRIDKLAENPFPSGYEKLKAEEGIYCVIQGDYRILYSVYNGKMTILVVKIGNRPEVYR